MPDIEQLVEKFRKKLLVDQELEKYRREVVNPLTDKIFMENFANVFFKLADEINNQLNFKVITCHPEGKARFVIEGQYHRIYFQKGKADIIEDVINASIIPICVWKGVTKHLGPISFFVKADTQQLEWDIPYENIEEYSSLLFSKLVEDEDFFM